MISHGSNPVDLHCAFRSTTIDIITSYCFAQSWSTLTYPSFQHPILVALTHQFTLIWVLHAFPILHKIISLVGPVLVMIDPSIKATVDFQERMAAQVDEILRNPETLERAEHEIVYHHFMARQPEKGRNEIPPRKALLAEGISLVVAGSDTVGSTVTVGVFHVLRNKQISSTLIKELEGTWPDKDTIIKFETLEKLPYLVGFCYGRGYKP
jgi:hypothetical protein